MLKLGPMVRMHNLFFLRGQMYMSTPVQQLPRPSAPGAVADPVVRDVLAEMEQEVATATSPPRPMPPMQPMPPMYYGAPPQRPHARDAKGWWNAEYAKRAVVAAAIAAFLLHPSMGETLARRVAFLDANQLYNIAVRVALLAAALYLIMVKLEM